MTAACFSTSPAGRHVPCRRRQRCVPVAHAAHSLGGQAPRPSGARCPRTRASSRTRHSAASTACSSTASRSSRTRRPRRRRPTGPTIFFLGRHEPRKGLDVLLEAMATPARRRAAVGRQRRARHCRAQGAVRRRHRESSGSAGSTDDEKAARGCGAPTCSARRRCGVSRSAWCCSRRWRPARRSSRATSPGYRKVARSPTATRCSCRPATPKRSPRRSSRVLDRSAALAARLVRGWRGAGQGVLDGPPRRPLPRALRRRDRGPRGALPLTAVTEGPGLRGRMITGHVGS